MQYHHVFNNRDMHDKRLDKWNKIPKLLEITEDISGDAHFCLFTA